MSTKYNLGNAEVRTKHFFFHLHYVLVKEFCINLEIFLKHRDSEIFVKWIRINQGVGVYFMNFYF